MDFMNYQMMMGINPQGFQPNPQFQQMMGQPSFQLPSLNQVFQNQGGMLPGMQQFGGMPYGTMGGYGFGQQVMPGPYGPQSMYGTMDSSFASMYG